MPPTDVTFRSFVEADLPFLFQVYASTRTDELARVPWDDEQKHRFLSWQFDAQHCHYQEHFSDAEYLVVLLRGEAIGRLYVDRRSDEIRLIDIALLPEHRGSGIGGALVRDLIAEGRRAGKPVRIHVERENPALRLYDRLGFRKLEEQGVYDLMEWSPSATAREATQSV